MTDDYSALQQPGPGYNSPTTSYGPLQSPVLASAQQSPGSGGGSGSGQAAAKTYVLPDAETVWSNNLARFPAVSKLPLYYKNIVNHNQVKQQGIANCYLAATLASMANTKAGVIVIKKMIASHTGPITTICKKFDGDKPPGPQMQLNSDRWFTVSFRNDAIDVSDVLYHDDSDHDPNLQYLTTPNGDKALWGPIIEVAYAKLKGGYDNISAGKGLTLDVFLNEFCTIDWDILYPGKDNAGIKKACSNAGAKPAFIATRTDSKILTHWHGIAVLGMSGTKVKLYDPLQTKELSIEFNDLLTEIQAIAASK
jgi:hypothetical protein